MKLSMTEQEKGELLIQVTAWTGLTVLCLDWGGIDRFKCCMIVDFKQFPIAQWETCISLGL